jgi:RHS repeat-associated protein
MAALRLGVEKPHQGLPSRNLAPHLGHQVCNCTVLLGMRGQAELNRAGSCCTGKERDAESGNAYFGARYYQSATGGVLSPDPSGLEYADPANPQSLNRCSCVLNNPLHNIDPSGTAMARELFERSPGLYATLTLKLAQNIGQSNLEVGKIH